MEISLKILVLILTILFTGLSAGLCFTWSNSIIPGISRLEDFWFLQSFQHMNREIINPMFLIIFFGPFILNLISIFLYQNQSSEIYWTLVTGGFIYIIGVILVTILGNVPLNEILEKADLSSLSSLELKSLRNRFEGEWNKFHLIRTVTSFASFIFLLIAYSQISKQ